MQLIIIDRQSKQVLDVLSNEAPFATPFDDSFSGGGLTDSLDTGMATYSFEVLKKYAAADHLVKGNEIAFRDKKGQDRLFQILIVESEHDKKVIHCVDTNLTLNNTIVRPYEAEKDYRIADYINRFLPSKSGFSIGINEIPHLSRKLVWEGHETVTKRLRSVATQFDNAYIGFRVVMQGSQVAARFIDIYKRRGKSIGTTLEYSKEVNNIYKTEDLSELATALIGIGGMKEGSEDQESITFKDRHYQSADNRFVSPAGDDRVYDLIMGPYWKENKPGMQTYEGYIERTFEYDTQSPHELFNRAANRLAELSQGANTYEVDVALLNDSIGLGDTVRIVDHDYQPELFLEADVLELTQHLSNEGRNTAVFGNFIEKESKIDAALRMAQEAMKQTQLQALYEWRAYADDDQGNGFTHRYSEEKEYMAILFVRNKPVPSDDPADYLGHWTKIRGSNGIDGDDGKTYYPWVVFADDANGKNISLDGNGKPYVGIGNGTNPVPSMNPADYKFQLRYDQELYKQVQDQIDSVPVVTVGTIRPENPKHGDQFWQQDSEGALTGYFKYVVTNGVGTWEPQLVDQALLNIYELNAVNINGSVINGSKFTSEFTGTDDYGRSIKGVFSIDGGVIKSDYLYPNETGRTGLMRLSHEGLASVLSRDGQGSINAGFNMNTVGLRMYSDTYETSLSNSALYLANDALKRYVRFDYTSMQMENRLALQVTKTTKSGSTTNVRSFEPISAGLDSYDNPSKVWIDLDASVVNFGNKSSTSNARGNRLFTADNKLYVTGDLGVVLSHNRDGRPTTFMYVGWDGIQVYKGMNMNGNIIINQSDLRLKENIHPTKIDPIKELRNIQFVDYTWKKDHPRNALKPEGQQYGMIAQHAGLMRTMQETDSDHYECIDFTKQVNLTTHAVIKLIEKNEKLETRIAVLEEKLNKFLVNG